MAEKGYELSARQLDELWQLDFTLAHELLGLPLRKCAAEPSTWGTPLDDERFQQVKLHIRRMWLRAALLFACVEDDEAGWGLAVNEQIEKNLSLTEKSFTILGWLAKAPSPEDCATGHRYLRSPIGTDLYLGGPISLANWSRTPTVKGICATSNKPPIQYSFYISTLKPLASSTAVTWNYGLKSMNPSFYSKVVWYYDSCCSEGVVPELQASEPSARASTSRKRHSGQISKRLRIVQAYRFCTYCGSNLEDQSSSHDPSKTHTKKNMKPHIALNHAVQISLDQGLQIDSQSDGVPHAEFFSQLHLVNRVLAVLESHNYVIIPACHFFKATNREPLPPAAHVDEEAEVFLAFKREAKEAFTKYRVVYLRGITVPSCYKDLLPVAKTSYSDISWQDLKPPRTNTFSIQNLLSVNEVCTLEREVRVNLESIVKTYSE